MRGRAISADADVSIYGRPDEGPELYEGYEGRLPSAQAHRVPRRTGARSLGAFCSHLQSAAKHCATFYVPVLAINLISHSPADRPRTRYGVTALLRKRRPASDSSGSPSTLHVRIP